MLRAWFWNMRLVTPVTQSLVEDADLSTGKVVINKIIFAELKVVEELDTSSKKGCEGYHAHGESGRFSSRHARVRGWRG